MSIVGGWPACVLLDLFVEDDLPIGWRGRFVRCFDTFDVQPHGERMLEGSW